MTSRGQTLPWVITEVFLFDAPGARKAVQGAETQTWRRRLRIEFFTVRDVDEFLPAVPGGQGNQLLRLVLVGHYLVRSFGVDFV